MMEITDVFMHKNCFKVKVSRKGKYQVNDAIYELPKGDYVIHNTYDFVRTLTPGKAKTVRAKKSSELDQDDKN